MKHDYDIIILGTGISASMLACILARQGVSTLMIDKSSHPRFAIGESTVPQSTTMISLMGDRWDVPELRQLSKLSELSKAMGTTCGVKRNFGFVYHREGAEQRPVETNQVGVGDGPRGQESHFYRQDIDAWLTHAAIAYGATVLQTTKVDDVEFEPGGVTVHSNRGSFRGRYVVDASGHRSILAEKFSLREKPCPLQTQSRAIFTHFVGVRPYDQFVEGHGMASPFHAGTLHHVFDGGWMWVIPFDNHEDSSNRLCSVGVQFDCRRKPKDERSGEQEFADFLDSFPAVRRQFDGARPVRDWVSTGRIQYSSKRIVGDRWCLLSHAAGFTDALYSRGLVNTTEVVHAVASRLLAAVRDDDFSAERFGYVERLQNGLVGDGDRVVHGSYQSFVDYESWNAFYRVWALGAFLGTARLVGAYERFRQTGDESQIEALERSPVPGSFAPDHPEFQTVLDRSVAAMDKLRAGELSASASAGEVYDALGLMREHYPPVFGLGDPEQRCISADSGTVSAVGSWAKTEASPQLRAYFGGDVQIFG